VSGPVEILRRSLVLKQDLGALPVEASDLVLPVPAFPGASFMEFERHRAVSAAAYEWCCARLDQLQAEGDPAFTAIVAAQA
jgi:hypothetical protein